MTQARGKTFLVSSRLGRRSIWPFAAVVEFLFLVSCCGSARPDHRKPVFAQSLVLFHIVPWKGRRRRAGTGRVARIIAQQSQGKRAASGCGVIAARAVQDVIVEGHCVTRFHRPFTHVHPFGVRIGDGHVGVVIGVKRGF